MKQGQDLVDCFREHLRDAEKNNTNASKSAACHFNLPNHSHHNITICGLWLTTRKHRKPQKSQTKICLSTGYTLSTGYQWTPLIPLQWSTSWSLYAYIGIFGNFHAALKVVSVILSWGLFQTTTFKRRQFAGLHIKLLFNGRPIFWCNILVPYKIYRTVLFNQQQ